MLLSGLEICSQLNRYWPAQGRAPYLRLHMITAEQARQLATPEFEKCVERLYPHIKRLAEHGKRQLRVGIDSGDDLSFWSKGASLHSDWISAKEILEQLGYTVSFKDEAYYTLIEW